MKQRIKLLAQANFDFDTITASKGETRRLLHHLSVSNFSKQHQDKQQMQQTA